MVRTNILLWRASTVADGASCPLVLRFLAGFVFSSMT